MKSAPKKPVKTSKPGLPNKPKIIMTIGKQPVSKREDVNQAAARIIREATETSCCSETNPLLGLNGLQAALCPVA